MTCFYDLPNELILIIIQKLGFNDLDNLRRVSVRFRTISELAKIEELIVFDEINLYGNFWYLRGERKSTDRHDTVRLRKFFCLRSIYKFNVNLKRLYISEFQDRQSKTTNTFDVLNELTELEHLELEAYLFNSDHYLSLPKLRFLKIDSRISIGNARLIIDTINLKVLRYKTNFNCKLDQRVIVRYPKSICYLVANVGQDIGKFENLGYFEELSLSSLDRGILRKLPKLKVLDIRCEPPLGLGGLIFGGLPQQDTIDFILSQKSFLKRRDLTIRIYGVKIDNSLKLQELLSLGAFKFKIKNIEKTRNYQYDDKVIYYDFLFNSISPYPRISTANAANFHLLPNLNIPNNLNLPLNLLIHPTFGCRLDSINFYDKGMSNLFSRRFPNLQSVICVNTILKDDKRYCRDVSVQDKLINFLNCLLCLKSICIRDCDFNQEFYDHLTNFKNLEGFEIRLNEENTSKIDFQFMLKLKQLSAFKIGRKFKNSSKLTIDLLKSLSHLEIVQYYIEADVFVKIYKNLTNRSHRVKYFRLEGDKTNELCTADNLSIDQLEDQLKVTFHPNLFPKPPSADLPSLFLSYRVGRDFDLNFRR